MPDANTAEFRLHSPPSDGISNVTFTSANGSNLLLASSWDDHVRLYDAGSNLLRFKYSEGSPVLDCAFVSGVSAYSCTLAGTLSTYDFNRQSKTSIGKHDDAIKCVRSSESTGTVVTGSWDKTCKIWDARTNECIGTHAQPDKVYAMDVCENNLVVCTAGRHVWIWDLRYMERPAQRRESNLKFQTRTVACFPSGTGYVMGSIEGRVAVEYFDPSAASQANKFAFKCHRDKTAQGETIYPVNAIAFHPTSNMFTTGGSEGIVNMWDPARKKRVCQIRPLQGTPSPVDKLLRYDTGISSLSFNHDGSLLAIGVSYGYERGEEPHAPDSIVIRSLPTGA